MHPLEFANARAPYPVTDSLPSGPAQRFPAESPLPTGALDRQGRFVAANLSLAQLLGRPAEQVRGLTLRQAAPGLADRAERIIGRIFRAGRPQRPVPFDSYVREGERHRLRRWRAFLHPLRDDRGEVRWAGFTVVEVSDCHQRGREARELHSLFHALLEQSPDAVFLKNTDSVYRYVNPAGAALLGRKPREVVGRSDADLLGPEASRKILERDRFLMRSPARAVTYEDEDCINGRRVVFQTTKSTVRNLRGEVTGLLGIAREVTDQKIKDEERALLIAKLEDTKRRLETEREIREQLVAALGHDLRSPLSVARMAAQVVSLEGAKGRTSRSFLARLDAALVRMDHMIRDLLDASRLAAGHAFAPRRARVRFPEVFRTALADLQVLYPERLQTIFPACEQEVHWDEGAIRRILENLVHNAIRHGAPGRPVTVRVDRVGHGKYAWFSVHNEGLPISAEAQRALFERFRRGPGAEAHGPGWGLGLSIVKALVQSHDGTLELESSEGRGTTFLVKFPI